MININKNGKMLKVPSSTKAYYERIGYVAETVMEPAEVPEENTGVVDDDADDWGDEDYNVDKPISQWTAEELDAYVIENEVDLNGSKEIADIRAAVKAHLED